MLLVLHLAVNAVEVLLAPLHPACDLRLVERALKVSAIFADEFLLIAARALQLALEHLVPVRDTAPEIPDPPVPA